MRVALFSETYLPYVSGVTVAVDALARGLGARGHRVLVVGPRPAHGQLPGNAGSAGPDPAYAWLPSYQAPAIVPPGYRMPWPAGGGAAIRQVAGFEPEVVHAHSPFVTGLLARAAARRLGVPLVFTHHTRFADYRHYLGPLAAPGAALTDAYLRRFWTSCAAVIAPSTDLAAEMEPRLGPRRRPRLAVIPTGLDVAGIRGLAAVDPRPLAGWPADAVVAITLGRLAREKSVDVVLEAVASAAGSEAAHPLRLLVVGDGPSALSLRRRAARPDLAGRVHFTGARPRREALALSTGADLFAFASQTETQGLVLAEALACGLPVVAIDGPGVRDSVRDGVDGLVVAGTPEAGRAGRLAAALTSLAGDEPLRRGLAARARADADRFDGALRMAETEALYLAVLED